MIDISPYSLLWGDHSFIHLAKIPYNEPSTRTGVAPILIAQSVCWGAEIEGRRLDQGWQTSIMNRTVNIFSFECHTSLLQRLNSRKQPRTIPKQMSMVCSNKTVFMGTGIWISYIFMCHEIPVFLSFINLLKMLKSSSAHKPYENWGFATPVCAVTEGKTPWYGWPAIQKEGARILAWWIQGPPHYYVNPKGMAKG